MAEVILKNVSKFFSKNKPVVQNINIEILDREFVVLVGPSGCGKSTTLRLIAGLEELTSGEIFIDGRIVNNLSPKDRDIAMVFQNYALYPHMTVYENIAFGMKLKNLPKDEIKERVNNAAKTLELEEYLDRKPKALSGGQRQRVALGRAIVRNPKVFLFDEPLSNLDAKLRVQMRAEIIKLHKRLNTTMIYVTHDQTEAMTMGEKIVVMKDGFIKQIDSPLNLYNYPKNKFVAGFIGSPAMNFVKGKIIKTDKVKFESEKSELSFTIKNNYEAFINLPVNAGIRPEDLHLEPQNDDNEKIDVKIDLAEQMGNEQFFHFTIEGLEWIVRSSSKTELKAGSKVSLYFNNNTVHLFSYQTEEII
jgi:multiple sugar transport system ATP-binding protein